MIKKYFTLIISIAFLLLVFFPLYADTKEHGKSVAEIMGLIREQQNVTSNSDINPDKVSDELLEQLGDAVMAEAHPDEREHALMDEMMGGEGSESLASMHRLMGYRYLKGEPYDDRYYGGNGMMGSGWMMDGPYRDGWGMHSFFWGYGGLLILAVIMAGVAGGVIYIIRNKGKTDSSRALAILKTRLAKGEITKQEYEQLKQDII